jgi:hypothetical protein
MEPDFCYRTMQKINVFCFKTETEKDIVNKLVIYGHVWLQNAMYNDSQNMRN